MHLEPRRDSERLRQRIGAVYIRQQCRERQIRAHLGGERREVTAAGRYRRLRCSVEHVQRALREAVERGGKLRPPGHTHRAEMKPEHGFQRALPATFHLDALRQTRRIE